jgi:hypothetical protein
MVTNSKTVKKWTVYASQILYKPCLVTSALKMETECFFETLASTYENTAPKPKTTPTL